MSRGRYIAWGLLILFIGLILSLGILGLGLLVVIVGLIMIAYGILAGRSRRQTPVNPASPGGQAGPTPSAPTIIYQFPSAPAYPPPSLGSGQYGATSTPVTVNVQQPAAPETPPQIMRRCTYCSRIYPESLMKCPGCGASF